MFTLLIVAHLLGSLSDYSLFSRHGQFIVPSAQHFHHSNGFTQFSTRPSRCSQPIPTIICHVLFCTSGAGPANLQCFCGTEAQSGFVPTSAPFSAVGTFLILRSASCNCSCTQKYRVSICFVLGPALNRSVTEFAKELSLWISTFCVDDVVIRVVDRWQVTSGLFLEQLETRHPLSRSRSVTHVHMNRITQAVLCEFRLQLQRLGLTKYGMSLRKSPHFHLNSQIHVFRSHGQPNLTSFHHCVELRFSHAQSCRALKCGSRYHCMIPICANSPVVRFLETGFL